MGLLGMFSAVSMATGWRLGPVKLSNPSESRSCGVGGAERQFQGLPRISSFLLLLSLVIAPLLSPSEEPSSLGRASGSQVCFHFPDGNAPRAARRPNLVGAISAKPIQTVGQSHVVAAKPPKHVCTFAQTMADASTLIDTSERVQSWTHLSRRRLHKRWFGLMRRAVGWMDGG